MDGQEFIISTIQALMAAPAEGEDPNPLEFIKYVSRSSLITIPVALLETGDAVIAELEKMSDENKDSSNAPMAEGQKLTMSYITGAMNVNVINEADWESAVTTGKSRYRTLKTELLNAAPGKVKNINFGEADVNYLTIESVPVVVFSCEVIVKSKI